MSQRHKHKQLLSHWDAILWLCHEQFFFSSHRKKQDKHQTVPMYRPTTSFLNGKKQNKKTKWKTLRLSRGAPSSLLTRPFIVCFYIQHCALCQQLIGCFANRNVKKKSWILPPALATHCPSLRHTMAASYCIKSLWMVELQGATVENKRGRRRRGRS